MLHYRLFSEERERELRASKKEYSHRQWEANIRALEGQGVVIQKQRQDAFYTMPRGPHLHGTQTQSRELQPKPAAQFRIRKVQTKSQLNGTQKHHHIFFSLIKKV
jgi:hypothetical protein